VQQASAAIPIADQAVERLHEVGELAIEEHGYRAEGYKQALRGDV
jgi:hypothetical protein